jgi:hypothetical protein
MQCVAPSWSYARQQPKNCAPVIGPTDPGYRELVGGVESEGGQPVRLKVAGPPCGFGHVHFDARPAVNRAFAAPAIRLSSIIALMLRDNCARSVLSSLFLDSEQEPRSSKLMTRVIESKRQSCSGHEGCVISTEWGLQQVERFGMLAGMKIVVVLPAYNAAETLKQTYDEIPHDIVDEVILIDDASNDATVDMAQSLRIPTVRHNRNRGYGGNQKTCYTMALARGADIVVMVHPDYQYTPKLVTAMAAMIASEQFDVVLASRILGRGALAGGMPLYKYISNRLLTLFENIVIGQKLSEYHTGYRAWSRAVLEKLPLQNNSDDFVFDNQMLAQCAHFGFRIGEISCPTKYFTEASSINFRRSVIYGLGVLKTSIQYRLQRMGLITSPLFVDTADARLPTLSKTDVGRLLVGSKLSA